MKPRKPDTSDILTAAAPAARSADTPPHRPAPARGDQTPIQCQDDGWGDTPVQMRGQ